MNVIPYEPRRIKYEFVTSVPMYDGRALGRVLDVLCAHPWLEPMKAGTEERHLEPFSIEAFPRTPGSPYPAGMHFARTKKLKYRAYASLTKNPRFIIDFDPKTSSKDWPTIFGVSDEVAAACEPDMGWVHFSSHVSLPSSVPGDELQKVIDLCTDSHYARWREYGPRGLGMRTYIGPLLIDQIGRSHLLSLPVPVVELPWGGVRIDLCERPWEATREQLHEAWLAAMQHLRPTGVFATYEVKPNGAVVWTRGPNLVNQGGRAP